MIFDLGAKYGVSRWGRGNGWFLVDVSMGNDVEDEPFSLEIACELIGETQQMDGIQVLHQEKDNYDEKEEE